MAFLLGSYHQSQSCLMLYLRGSASVSILGIAGAVRNPCKHAACTGEPSRNTHRFNPSRGVSIQQQQPPAFREDQTAGNEPSMEKTPKPSNPTQSKHRVFGERQGDGTPPSIQAPRGSEIVMSKSLVSKIRKINISQSNYSNCSCILLSNVLPGSLKGFFLFSFSSL